MSAYSVTCAKCFDPIQPGAPTVDVRLPTGETVRVHVECFEPPAPAKRMTGAERGR